MLFSGSSWSIKVRMSVCLTVSFIVYGCVIFDVGTFAMHFSIFFSLFNLGLDCLSFGVVAVFICAGEKFGGCTSNVLADLTFPHFGMVIIPGSMSSYLSSDVGYVVNRSYLTDMNFCRLRSKVYYLSLRWDAY